MKKQDINKSLEDRVKELDEQKAKNPELFKSRFNSDKFVSRKGDFTITKDTSN